MRAGIFASARHAAAGVPVTATFQTATGDIADQSTYTFPGQPIGTASATRRVVVSVCFRSSAGRNVSAITIGGVAAARDAQTGASPDWGQIWSAVVPTGTTASVVVALSGGNAEGCGLGVWTLNGGGPTGQTATSNVNSATITQSVNTAVGDVVIGVVSYRVNGAAVPRVTWNSAIERFDGPYDTNVRQHSGADAVAVGASTDMGLFIAEWSADSTACAAAYA